jgi:hypothetical protein
MVNDALSVLEGKARFESPEREAEGGDSESERPEKQKSQGTLLFQFAIDEGVELSHDRSLVSRS